MAKRKITYRKRNQNRLSMFLVVLVVLMIMVVVAVRSVELQRKLDESNARIENLDSQIAAEHQRTEDIAKYEKETKTKKFAIEMARDLFGLVFPGEITFKEED